MENEAQNIIRTIMFEIDTYMYNYHGKYPNHILIGCKLWDILIQEVQKTHIIYRSEGSEKIMELMGMTVTLDKQRPDIIMVGYSKFINELEVVKDK